jgi:hypothetical protein
MCDVLTPVMHVQDLAVWYLTLSMLCEVNSVFLHLVSTCSRQ